MKRGERRRIRGGGDGREEIRVIERSRGVMWRGRDEGRGEEEERLGRYDGKQLCVTE